MLNLIKEQDDIDKMYFYSKYFSELKYEFLVKKREDVEIKYCKDPNVFIACSDIINDVHQNIDDYNPSRKRKILIVFDDMIVDIMSNKKFQAIIKELFMTCRKVSISLVFITQS